MTDTPTPAEIETLRKGIRLNATPDERRAACDLVDRLSPAPEPEVDEATRVTLKMLDAWYAGVSNPDRLDNMCFPDARAIIAALIASKDGEIELERARLKIADEEVDNLRNELVAVRAEKADFLWRRRAEKAESEIAVGLKLAKELEMLREHCCTIESELATLRAENEGLKGLLRWAHDTLYEINLGNYDHDEVCELNSASVEVILGIAPEIGETHGKSPEWWAEHKAAERNPAEPAEEVLQFESNPFPEAPGTNADAVEVTQPTDDLAAQMVREMLSIPPERWETAMYVNPILEAIARRYMEKAVATVSADAFHDGYHAGKIDAGRQPEKGSTDE